MSTEPIKRQVFFSFEYCKDCWRAAQIRNMGVVDAESTFSDNDWEEVKSKSDENIKKWIDNQMAMRSCVVVLIGETTATRKWVRYEIQKAYELNKGLVGIYIHNLSDNEGNTTSGGQNPFDLIPIVYPEVSIPLSRFVTCYNPVGRNSKEVYGSIKDNLSSLIENAINNRPPHLDIRCLNHRELLKSILKHMN